MTPGLVTPGDFDDAQILALMQAYLDAEYRWELAGRWQPLQIGKPAPTLETAFPEAREFGLLSAWNPYSVERPEAENRRADAALHAALDASARAYRPGFSSARNRLWREPSWVVADMPVAEFDALARRFDQLATVHLRRDEPARLRMYRPAPAKASGHGFVDWLG